ncbi:MAG: hypothetical protein GX033_01805 [Firmicutes bacterium]|nr:hypothetical protein [Bacillota bacterium]
MIKRGNKLFRQNITLHVLAALLAIVLWSYVKTADFSARPETSVTIDEVPLEVRDIPTGLVLINELPATVSVVLRGSDSVVNQVLKENLLAYVSLSGANEGVGQYAVKVIHPQGLSATPNPGRVEVRLERELTADFEIKLEGLEPSDPSYYLTATPDPNFVRVTGLRSQFERVQQAQVMINQASIRESGKLQLPVKLLDSRGQEVTGLLVEPGVIEVDIVRLPGKLLPVVADLTDQLPEGYQLQGIQVEPESVYVYAPTDVLAALEQIVTQSISLEDITADTTLSVPLILPTGAVGSSIDKVEVQLTIGE